MSEELKAWRKKPVVIHAIQYGPATCERICELIGIEHRVYDGEPCGVGEFVIPTLEGDMKASPGDYIVRGVKGEFYPCKPDIFLQTNEPADTPARPSVSEEKIEEMAGEIADELESAQWIMRAVAEEPPIDEIALILRKHLNGEVK